MEREYLAKFKSRKTGITIAYYKEDGCIYSELNIKGELTVKKVKRVPSRILYSFEEIGLEDGS